MTGELPTRYGVESRPSRSNIHLLHSAKTDEIEVLESGAINHHTNIANGGVDNSRTKVSILAFSYENVFPSVQMDIYFCIACIDVGQLKNDFFLFILLFCSAY